MVEEVLYTGINLYALRAIKPLLFCFTNEMNIKIVLYAFSSSVIELVSNEK